MSNILGTKTKDMRCTQVFVSFALEDQILKLREIAATLETTQQLYTQKTTCQ